MQHARGVSGEVGSSGDCVNEEVRHNNVGAVDAAVASASNRPDAHVVQWPSIGTSPINEFRTPYLASRCFPSLFPDASGDPTRADRYEEVSETEGFKHLMKFSDADEDGVPRWRFAGHPRFTHWANNRL